MTSGSAPSSWQTIARTSSYENGSTWFSSRKSSSQYAAGSRSNRRASIWPSLIQAPPRRSNARRSRTGPGRRSDPGRWSAGARRDENKTMRTRQTRRGCLNSVLTWRRADQRRRAAGGSAPGVGRYPWPGRGARSPQEPSSSMETRLRGVGSEVSSSHSRPARTSSANVRRESRRRGRRRPRRPAGPRARAHAAPDALGEHRLTVVERVGDAALPETQGVRLALLGRGALQPRLAALTLAGGPLVDLGLGRLGGRRLGPCGARGRRPPRFSHGNHPCDDPRSLGNTVRYQISER